MSGVCYVAKKCIDVQCLPVTVQGHRYTINGWADTSSTYNENTDNCGYQTEDFDYSIDDWDYEVLNGDGNKILQDDLSLASWDFIRSVFMNKVNKEMHDADYDYKKEDCYSNSWDCCSIDRYYDNFLEVA